MTSSINNTITRAFTLNGELYNVDIPESIQFIKVFMGDAGEVGLVDVDTNKHYYGKKANG